MYIQPSSPPSAEEFSLPKGYSGNAFRRSASPEGSTPPTEGGAPLRDTAPAAEPMQAPATPVQEPPPGGDTTSAQAQNEAESVPVMGHTEKQGRGLLGRFPFLSSLLPPPRDRSGKGGVLPEWLLIGAVILLFFTEEDGNDILPLLLLLLLWD